MKRRGLVLTIVLGCAGMFGQDIGSFAKGRDASRLAKFQLWGYMLDSKTSKETFVMGFTNGFFSGATLYPCADSPKVCDNTKALVNCILGTDDQLGFDQAIAMIDKYYKGNPEKWNLPIGDAILEALTIKGGPCADAAPKK